MTVTCPDISAIASAIVAASLSATTRKIPTAGSIAGGRARPAYDNASIPNNGTANTRAPGGAGDLAPSGSGEIQAPAAGTAESETPARSADVPLMSDSAATSVSFVAPYVSVGVGTATMNAFDAGPTKTFTLKPGNGAEGVLVNLGSMSFSFLVAILLI
jgi:hypothetical protein